MIATTFASLDVILQTHLVPARRNSIGCERQSTSAQWEEVVYQFQHRLGHMHVGVWAVILGTTTPLDPASEKDPRILLLGDTYPRIGLIVLEQDIVARTILLDERIFEMQSILLATDHNILQVGNIAHQHARLGRIVVLLVEVRRHTPLEILGLTHIDNRTLFIDVLVYTGTIGQEGKNILYMSIGIGQYRINI